MNGSSLYAAFPEIFLAAAAMMLLIAGVFCNERGPRLIGVFSIVALLATGILVLKLANIVTPLIEMTNAHTLQWKFDCYGCAAFNGMFINDAFARFVKIVLLIAGALSLMLSFGWMKNAHIEKPEYPVLVLFSILGMMLMVSANDLLALYVGLELQSLALYVLAAIQRDNAKSSEAGLKYFVLGALSSGLILYGISLIYGYAGTTGFEALAKTLSAAPSLGVIFGMVFVCAALAFKVSAVPFHMWTPDVYEGAPTPVTAFFAAAPKIAALALFTRVLLMPFGGLAHQWLQIVIFIAVASMILGSFAGLVQSNAKRLLAYSSIANVGFALVGLAVGGDQGVQALLIYLAIYFLNTLGAFAVIISLRRQGMALERLDDFAGLAKAKPLLALAMVVFMFSLAGVPPLAGFFGKYFIFLAAVKAHMVPLAVIGVLTSVVSAYYYLRIIKLMYFDEPPASFDVVPEPALHAVVALTALAMLLFVLCPAPLVDSALSAAQSLIGG
jgi:NADH-quinone oxidoreductase subunit N